MESILYKEKPFNPEEQEEDNSAIFNDEDPLLTVDKNSKKVLNIWPVFESTTVAIPLRNSRGQIERDEKGRPVIDRIVQRRVFKKYMKHQFYLPNMVDMNVPKSQLLPTDYPFVLTCRKLIASILQYQFKKGIPMTNALLFFNNMMMDFLHYKRAFIGYGGRLSKSQVRYYYTQSDEAERYSRMQEEGEAGEGPPAEQLPPAEAKAKGKSKKKGPSPFRENLFTEDQVDWGRMRL